MTGTGDRLGAIRAWLRDPRVTPFGVKAFVVTVAVLAVAIPLALIAVPYIDFFNDMAVQRKVKPQMAWTVRDGRTIPADFPPPAGTLATGEWEYPFPVTRRPPPPSETEAARLARVAWQDDQAGRAGAALQAGGPDIPPAYVPPRPTMETMKRGQKRFNQICIACHGEYALGNGRVPPRGFPPAPSLLDARQRAFPDGRIFHVITNGQGPMPSYARQLPPADRWAVVHFVRALQQAFPAPPPDPTVDAAPAVPPAPVVAPVPTISPAPAPPRPEGTP